MNTVDTLTANGFNIEIMYDTDCESPRHDDMHAAELALTHSRYDLPDDSGAAGNYDDLGELEDAIRATCRMDGNEVLYVATVYGYDHGGLVLHAGERTYPFSDPWDSGIAGLAYVTTKNWADCQGTEWTGSDEQVARAAAMVKADVDVYSQWANGECYGYSITDPADGEIVGDCWGFVGDINYVITEAKAEAEATEHEIKCNGTLNRVTGEVEHTAACPLPAHQECDCLVENTGPRLGGAITGCPKHDARKLTARVTLVTGGEPRDDDPAWVWPPEGKDCSE